MVTLFEQGYSKLEYQCIYAAKGTRFLSCQRIFSSEYCDTMYFKIKNSVRYALSYFNTGAYLPKFEMLCRTSIISYVLRVAIGTLGNILAQEEE